MRFITASLLFTPNHELRGKRFSCQEKSFLKINVPKVSTKTGMFAVSIIKYGVPRIFCEPHRADLSPPRSTVSTWWPAPSIRSGKKVASTDSFYFSFLPFGESIGTLSKIIKNQLIYEVKKLNSAPSLLFAFSLSREMLSENHRPTKYALPNCKDIFNQRLDPLFLHIISPTV